MLVLYSIILSNRWKWRNEVYGRYIIPSSKLPKGSHRKCNYVQYSPPYVSNVTSKHNAVTCYRFSHVFRAIIIKAITFPMSLEQ
jgi:hypothetical protein